MNPDVNVFEPVTEAFNCMVNDATYSNVFCLHTNIVKEQKGGYKLSDDLNISD